MSFISKIVFRANPRSSCLKTHGFAGTYPSPVTHFLWSLLRRFQMFLSNVHCSQNSQISFARVCGSTSWPMWGELSPGPTLILQTSLLLEFPLCLHEEGKQLHLNSVSAFSCRWWGHTQQRSGFSGSTWLCSWHYLGDHMVCQG